MANVVIGLTVEVFLTICTRGALKAHGKRGGGKKIAGGGAGHKPQSDIKAQNQAKADAKKAEADKKLHENSKVAMDSNTTWRPDSFKKLGKDGLPVYDGKTTYGTVQVGNNKYYVKSGQGEPGLSLRTNPSIKAGAVAPSHAEGHAAAILRQTGAKEATLRINNPNGPCGFCKPVLPNMLPTGTKLNLIWPNGSKTYTGN